MIDYRFICLVAIANIAWGIQPFIQKRVYLTQTTKDGEKGDPVLAVVIVTAYMYCIIVSLFGLTKQNEIRKDVARFGHNTFFFTLTNAVVGFFIPIVSVNYLVKLPPLKGVGFFGTIV